MLVGYMRVSKADGSQTVELQRDALIRDALIAAGVAHLYDDHPLQRFARPRAEATTDAICRDGAARASWECGSPGLLDQVFRFLLGVVGYRSARTRCTSRCPACGVSSGRGSAREDGVEWYSSRGSRNRMASAWSARLGITRRIRLRARTA